MLYLATAQVLMNKISKDMYHRFLCRGYEDRFGMTREVMRSEISVQLKKYIKEIIGRLANEK